MMKRLFYLAAALLAVACARKPQEFHVIPMPADVSLAEGSYSVAGKAFFMDPHLDDASSAAIWRFKDALEVATGRVNPLGKDGIQFLVNPNLGAEQYAINVNGNGVVVEASALNGFVYACETLKQMRPAGIYSGKRAKGPWVLPYVSILDQPRFGYRGTMIDSARHFWSVEEMKNILDVMAAFKQNRLHWHLTDDQGWRIEIKAYPKLTEVGAWRAGTQIGKDQSQWDDVRYGGFYTQDELREVVAYAAARGITVIPEIDLPGHMVAALAAYPELGCTGGPYEVRKIWGIALDILCAGNEEIYTFIDKVFDEVTDIFPSEYVHVGGDECFGGRRHKMDPVPWDNCPKCKALMRKLHIKPGLPARHLVQDYVTRRVQKILADKGRKIIGWDEILEGNLEPGATVMSWRGTAGGEKAVAKGMNAIMSPNSYLYIDYYQSPEFDKEPMCIGSRVLPVEKVYSYEPMEGMPEDAEDYILGVQCNLWTEYIGTNEGLEYMLLPRMCAAAEIGWVEADAKDPARFDASLDHSFEIFDAMGLNYCLDSRGLIGLDRIPARDSLALAEYLATRDQ